jgi:hypothetical protein
MRLKWFSDEIPFCTEDLLSLDDELLEEECETDSSFFTFISGLEKIHEKLTNNKDEFHASQFSSVVESDEVAVDVRGLITCSRYNHDILAHCELAVTDLNWNTLCTNSGEICYTS